MDKEIERRSIRLIRRIVEVAVTGGLAPDKIREAVSDGIARGEADRG